MLFYKSAIFLALVMAVLGQDPITVERPQQIRFFTTVDCRPPSFGTPFFDYTETRNITNEQSPVYMSYCVIRGAWRVEYAWVQNPNDFNISVGDSCVSCMRGGTNTRRYGYIQRISGRDLTKASFSLFTEMNFQGREVQINGWEHTFNDTYSFSSVAFSSFSNWTWQAYYLPRFRGSSTCFRPNIGSEMTLMRSTSVSVGSVRLGCRNSAHGIRYGKSGTIAIPIVLLLFKLCWFFYD